MKLLTRVSRDVAYEYTAKVKVSEVNVGDVKPDEGKACEFKPGAGKDDGDKVGESKPDEGKAGEGKAGEGKESKVTVIKEEFKEMPWMASRLTKDIMLRRSSGVTVGTES